MSQLGSMMQRAGLLSEGQVAAAREYAVSNKMALVDALLRLGLTDDDALVAFSASKLLIPRVHGKLLERVEAESIAKIPAHIAWQYHVLPVSSDAHRNLTVAMLDPTEVAAVRAVAAQTGMYVIRAVAPGEALKRALTFHYGSREKALFDPAATQPAIDLPSPEAGGERLRPAASHTPPQSLPAAPPPGAAPPALTHLEPEPSADSLEAPGAPPPSPIPPLPTPHPAVSAATRAPPPPSSRPRSHSRTWNPPLSGQAAEPVPLSDEALQRFLPDLREAESRDDVTAALLDYLAAGFRRTILFVHSRGELRGHDARGPDLKVEAVKQVRIPASGDSMFARAIERASPVFGPMGSSAIDKALAQALGGVRGNVLILPIIIASKTPLLVFAHGSTNPVDPASVKTLSEEVSDALHSLIRQARRASASGSFPQEGR
jgi:hypothetical protein